MERITLFIVTVGIGIIVTLAFELILKANKKLREKYYRRHEILFGYHVHHSTVGLICFVIGGILLLLNQDLASLSTCGIGVGIIIMHTASARRLVFIEKNNFKKTQQEEKSRI